MMNMDKDSDEYLEDDVDEESNDGAKQGPVRMSLIKRTATLICGLTTSAREKST